MSQPTRKTLAELEAELALLLRQKKIRDLEKQLEELKKEQRQNKKVVLENELNRKFDRFLAECKTDLPKNVRNPK